MQQSDSRGIAHRCVVLVHGGDCACERGADPAFVAYLQAEILERRFYGYSQDGDAYRCLEKLAKGELQ